MRKIISNLFFVKEKETFEEWVTDFCDCGTFSYSKNGAVRVEF